MNKKIKKFSSLLFGTDKSVIEEENIFGTKR